MNIEKQPPFFAGFLGMTTGLYMNNIAFTFYSSPTNLYTYLFFQLAASLQQTIFWLLPPFMIQILLAHFQVKCQSRKIHLFKDSIKCIDEFGAFSKALRLFLMNYFMFNQSFAIFYIFAVLITAMRTNILEIPGALFRLIGKQTNFEHKVIFGFHFALYWVVYYPYDS